jgi:hypothetical protein
MGWTHSAFIGLKPDTYQPMGNAMGRRAQVFQRAESPTHPGHPYIGAGVPTYLIEQIVFAPALPVTTRTFA